MYRRPPVRHTIGNFLVVAKNSSSKASTLYIETLSEELKSKLIADIKAAREEEEIPSRDRIKSYLLSQCKSRGFILYVLLQFVAWYLEFGAVFFVLGLLYFIFTNLSDRKRKPEELSAYSVFNPNCQRIDGTVDASEMINNIVSGPFAFFNALRRW